MRLSESAAIAPLSSPASTTPPPQASWAFGAARCSVSRATLVGEKGQPNDTGQARRHVAGVAILAAAPGANPKVVQRMLGHASAAMTLDVYADLFESDLDAVAENVAKMWPPQAEAR